MMPIDVDFVLCRSVRSFFSAVEANVFVVINRTPSYDDGSDMLSQPRLLNENISQETNVAGARA